MMLKRKGQAVNIDWSIGLALFLTAIVGGVLITVNGDTGAIRVSEADQKAFLIQQELREETFREGRTAPLIVDTPVNLSASIPLDRSYLFSGNAYPGSGAMDVPAEINISGDRVVTVTGLANASFENSSHQVSYFFSNTSNLSYSNDIDTGAWLNNSRIQLKPGNNGLDSMRIDDQEILNETADLDGSDFSTQEGELHSSSLDGDLKIYNGSREIILEDAGETTFYLGNLSTLYWYSDNSTTGLAGTGNFRSGDTKGFTVASDYGATFIGDMEANVSKPSSSTVKAEINSSRLRIFLHDSNYTAGRKRALIFDQGDIFFGVEKKIEGASKQKIEQLENLSQREFEDRLSIGDFGYNITFGSLKNGTAIPLENVVVSDSPAEMLGRYGNYSRIESRVSIWN